MLVGVRSPIHRVWGVTECFLTPYLTPLVCFFSFVCLFVFFKLLRQYSPTTIIKTPNEGNVFLRKSVWPTLKANWSSVTLVHRKLSQTLTCPPPPPIICHLSCVFSLQCILITWWMFILKMGSVKLWCQHLEYGHLSYVRWPNYSPTDLLLKASVYRGQPLKIKLS